jgi:hypothetical protein
MAFSNGARSWTEQVNAIDLAAAVLKKRNHSVTNEKTWLLHGASGFMILPQLVAVHPLDDGGVRTVTTMQTNHPVLTPDGVFEYQHSAGDSVADAVSKGFDQWVQTDFVALLEALRPTPESCTIMKMTFPATDARPARTRRVVLGPVAHFMQEPPAKAAQCGTDEHPFCPCCLLTRSFEAFRELIEGDGFYGIRLFAHRTPEGVPEADCRVNGEDWEKGAQALREYAKTWPAAGYEFRKQYIVLQNIKEEA